MLMREGDKLRRRSSDILPSAAAASDHVRARVHCILSFLSCSSIAEMAASFFSTVCLDLSHSVLSDSHLSSVACRQWRDLTSFCESDASGAVDATMKERRSLPVANESQ